MICSPVRSNNQCVERERERQAETRETGGMREKKVGKREAGVRERERERVGMRENVREKGDREKGRVRGIERRRERGG